MTYALVVRKPMICRDCEHSVPLPRNLYGDVKCRLTGKVNSFHSYYPCFMSRIKRPVQLSIF